jgi:exodeoxyribonuclease-3
MKIYSWNVNGLRAVLRKGSLVDFLEKERPDILCLQEIKISEAKLEKENLIFPGYDFFTNGARREGYSGTAVLVKKSLKIKAGAIKNFIGIDEFDHEGRIQILELDKFYLLNLYFPNANHELSRLSYKLNFNEALLKYVKKLEKKKPVVLTGDFNVAHNEIDLANPKQNIGNPGFTYEERDWFTKFLKAGFIDTYRYLNGDKIQYTWWSFRFNVRARNIGWRIDYFCVSDKMNKALKKAEILDKITGSDHAPVMLEIKL